MSDKIHQSRGKQPRLFVKVHKNKLSAKTIKKL